MECYHRELADKVGESQQAIFDSGTNVGQLARQLYPDGLLINADHFHFDEALANTKPALANQSISAIFESAFRYDDIRVRPDILVRISDCTFDMIEVKSSTQFKDEHIPDAAIQYYVLACCGVIVRKVFIAYLNKEYVYTGGEYDLTKLFIVEDVNELVQEFLPEIPINLENFRVMLSKPQIPDIAVGKQCNSPHDCAFYGYCHKNLPEHYIMQLPRISETLLASLRSKGIDDIKNIPATFPGLNITQRLVRDCVVNNVCQIDDTISEELKLLVYPIHFLDFETFNPALPIYMGTHPYQLIPFQWSDHIMEKNGTLRHEEYLHDGFDDPRRSLAINLLNTLGTEGSIVVYSSFELSRIREMAKVLPDLSDGLLSLENRIVDLLALVRKYCYHPEFHGSFSIKSVLPALVPDLGYDDLEIQEGGIASLAYTEIIQPNTLPARRAFLRQSLLAYCSRDTEAEVSLYKVLRTK
jgi:predicted RecB family nuclease